MNNKIPKINLPEKYYDYNFIDSPLVEVTQSTGIIVNMQYPKLKMKNAINKCLVRKEVLDRLIEAKKYLPKGITFEIWDAYRTISLQKELYYKYREKIINEFDLMDKTEEERNRIINSYVSYPIFDEDYAPLHTTGGAVDITLAYIDTKKSLDLGVSFDSFSSLTKTSAFEKEGMDIKIRNNRRILYNAMIKVGFTNLPSECWHFDYGNRNWSYYTKKPILYKGIFTLNKK